MVRSSRQHKCALVFCGLFLLFLGGGIAASAFIHEFLAPYKDITATNIIYFTYTQYWLGIPIFVLGLYILFFTVCCKVKCLMVFGFIFSSLMLVSSICGIILHGPAWRSSLFKVKIVNDNNCEDDSMGNCSCGNEIILNPLSCNEIKYVAVLNSLTAIFSAVAIVFCQFACFIYCRILGWMHHLRYDNPIDYYAKTLGTHYSNGYHHGRANEVVLNRIN